MRERLAHAVELLDAPVHDRIELERALAHVAEINRWLGGRRAVLRALAPLLSPGQPWLLLDVGTGSADIPLVIDRWARVRSLDVRILATDVHAQIRAVARARTRTSARIAIGAADARALPFHDRAVDIVLLSMTLHHFERFDQIRVLREAMRVARRAVIINELERGWSNYAGARLLAFTWWRRNRLTRHDGPLSVLRAFRRAELAALAHAADARVESLHRRYFRRLVMVLDAR